MATIYNKNNMSASDVRKMQNALISQGYDLGPTGADGVWGNKTSEALSQYKAATGGSNTAGSTVGNETFKKLYGSNGTSGSNIGTNSGTKQTYVVKAGDTGNYADVVNKAQAYLSGGTYTAGQTIDTDWWGDGGGKAKMYGNDQTYKGKAMTTTDMSKALEYANAYDQMIAAQEKENALAKYQDMETYYNNMYSQMQAQYEANQAAALQRTEATIDSINSNREDINSDFEKAQKENYINKVLQQNQMNDYLTAMGYSGGMAESTLQGINNNYASNRQMAVEERDKALREMDKLVAEAQASGNADLTNLANDYYTNYVNMLNNQAQMNYQIATDQREQANADRAYQLQLASQKLNENLYQDERVDAEEATKQQLAANDFESFLNTYQGKYTKEATYKKWIENLEKMEDPYGYNKQKIAYLTQYINSGMGTKKKSNPMKTDSTYQGYQDDTGSQNISSYANMVNDIASGKMPYVGGKISYGSTSADAAIDYLQDLYTKGAITEAQVTSLAKNAGLIV